MKYNQTLLVRFSAIISLCSVVWLFPGPAVSQQNVTGNMEWEADSISMDERTNRVTLLGNVRLKKDDLTIGSNKVQFAYTKTSSGSIQVNRIDALGAVVLNSSQGTATGNVGIYDIPRNLFTMLGAVKLSQNGNEFFGDRLLVDLSLRTASLSANGGKGTESRRVSGRLTFPTPD
jgi:lipopolysaccharide export system protein LptA